MSITASELKMNLSKYLKLSEREDILITKNGKVVAKLTNPYQDRVNKMRSLFGIVSLDEGEDENSLREERLSK